MTSYLNAIYGIETVRMVVILKDINIDVYDTLYAPFYNLSGEFSSKPEVDNFGCPDLFGSFSSSS